MTSTEINGKKPKFFNSAIAANGDKNTIDATGTDEQVSQSLGFGNKFSTPRGSGGKSVGRRDMNGLFHDVSSLNYYFQYTGRNPWVADTKYPKGAKVWHDGTNAEYVSTADDNTTTPGDTGASWIKLNDLSGTSGGGSTVDCAWSGKGSDITTLLANADKVNGVLSSISSLSGDVSSLSNKVDSISTKMDNISVKPACIDSSVQPIKITSAAQYFDGSYVVYMHLPSERPSSTSVSYFKVFCCKNSSSTTEYPAFLILSFFTEGSFSSDGKTEYSVAMWGQYGPVYIKNSYLWTQKSGDPKEPYAMAYKLL